MVSAVLVSGKFRVRISAVTIFNPTKIFDGVGSTICHGCFFLKSIPVLKHSNSLIPRCVG